MSTKTTFKRIALVAVAAMGFGMLSVVPSNAARVASTMTVDGITITTPTQTLNVGNTASSTFGLSMVTAGDGTLFGSVDVAISVPAGSAITTADRTGGTGGVIITNAAAVGTTTVPTNSVAGDHVQNIPVNAELATATPLAGTITFVPDAPGTYTVTLTGNTLGSPATANAVIATMTVTVRSLSYTTGDTTAATPFSTGTGVAGVANTVTLTAYSTKVANQKALVTVSGAGATIQSASNSTVSTDFLSTVVNAAASSSIVLKTPTAGTVTVSLFNETSAGSGLYSTTASNTVTITVNSAAVNNSLDAANSTATLTAVGTGATLSTDALSVSGPKTANNNVASIAVALAVNSGSLPSTTSTSITITGPGLLTVSGSSNTSGNGTGRSLTETGTDAAFAIAVNGDGNSGVATVTITTGAFTATRTVTFYGSVTSYVLSAKSAYVSVGVTTNPVVTVLAKDAAGITVPGAIFYASSSSTATATVSAASFTTNADAVTASNIGVTGMAAGVATITVGNAASAPTVSATYVVNIVKAGISAVTLSFDKTEYTPGEKATITVTAKNADAALVGDAIYAALFTAAGITSSVSLNGYTANASVATVNGVKTYTVYMPLASGPVTISATLDTSVAAAIQATAVTASTTVVPSAATQAANDVAQAAADAAAEATDAANAATDAANAAAEAADAATAAAQDAADAVAALSVQVSEQIAVLKAQNDSLRKQLIALTNLIIKIQKKVRA